MLPWALAFVGSRETERGTVQPRRALKAERKITGHAHADAQMSLEEGTAIPPAADVSPGSHVDQHEGARIPAAPGRPPGRPVIPGPPLEPRLFLVRRMQRLARVR